MATPSSDKLHLGCGLMTPPTWLNVDGSFNARLAKYPLLHKAARLVAGKKDGPKFSKNIYGHDLRKPLPWAEGSFKAVYASHLLEHMYRSDAEFVLRECFRVLRPGGVVRIVVPDLAPLIRGYMTGEFPKWLDAHGNMTERADRLILGLLMRVPQPARTNAVKKVYDNMYDFHSHKWMYDAASLTAMLRRAGFSDVTNPGVFESRIAEIREVEQESRVVDGAGVVAEGVKE